MYGSGYLYGFLYIGYRLIPRSKKATGGGVNQPHKSCAEVKERVELCVYSPSEPSWQVIR